jgi:hypothetical protein
VARSNVDQVLYRLAQAIAAKDNAELPPEDAETVWQPDL